MSEEQPIQEEYLEQMRVLAKVIDEFINPNGIRKNGFSLLMFKFGEAGHYARTNYISNADRKDMLEAMKEFIARAEGKIQ